LDANSEAILAYNTFGGLNWPTVNLGGVITDNLSVVGALACRVDGGVETCQSDGALVPWPATSRTWWLSYTIAARSEGVTETVRFYGVDGAGNRSAPITRTLRVDTLPPRLTVTQTLTEVWHNDYINLGWGGLTNPITDAVPILTGTLTEAALDWADLRIEHPNDGLWTTNLVRFPDGRWHGAPQLDFSVPGVHTITVRARDLSGNWTVAGPFNLLVKPVYNLSLSKTVTPTTGVRASDLITYTQVILNRTERDNGRVTNLRLTDTLPAEVTLVSAPPECSGSSELVCLWPAPTIGENEHLTVTLVARITDTWTGTPLVNRAEVSADGKDSDSSDNTAAAVGAILYAAPTARGAGDCSSWADACTLQSALSVAGYGSEIWVQSGVHYPGAASNRTATFTLKDGVRLYGGFAGTEIARDARDWRANKTILSGDIDRNDITVNGVATNAVNIVGANALHVLRGENLGAATVVDGFIITAGQADSLGYPHYSGGGMYLYNSSPTLAHLTFSSNLASLAGGGLRTYGGHPVLNDVTFHGNQAGMGGGMSNENGGATTLVNVVFSHNRANDHGGGMVNNSAATLINVVFSANSAGIYGGGMTNYGDSTLINVTFNGNSAGSAGGGLYNFWATPALTNAILWGNSALTGPEIANDNSTATISYSDIRGCGGSGSGWNPACGSDGGGNIDADSRFVDAANGDLRLQLTSPAIDAGNNAAVPPGVTTDLDGNPRFVDFTGRGNAIVDMGAYESPPNYAPSFTSTPVTTAVQGVLYTYAITTTDPDLPHGDVLTVTAPITLPAWLTLTDHGNGTATLSGTPTNPDVGDHTVTLRVSDSGGLTATQSFTITVANVNDAPRFISAPVTTATQGVTYTYAVAATDPDLPYGDVLTVTALALPAWLTLTDHGNGMATLSGTPTNPDVGEHPVVLRVTDRIGAFAEQTFTITITVAITNVNDAPRFTSTPVATAVQGVFYTYAITTTDPDLPHGDVLTVTAPTTLPAWLTLTDHGNGTATLSGTPTDAHVGSHPLTLRVSDSGGLTATQAFTITVAAKPVYTVFLPLVARNYVSAPDLIVQNIIATPNNIQVVIANPGNVPVKNEFWVDVYIAPRTAPTRVNQT
jgi:hypothetical protein